MDKVLLIDGNNLIWRACIAFGPPVPHTPCQQQCEHKANEQHCQCGAPWDSINQCYGEKYGFVFNFFRNLRPLIADFAPDKCFFVLEGHPQFRYDLFADYKGNRIIKEASRKKNNDKFLQAQGIIVPLMQHLPITICRAADYEADDVIGTLCENMKEEELNIISTDTDYIQLLQRGYPNIRLYNPIKKVDMEAPSYPYVAWKCLNGDTSDNIPALLKPKKAINAASDPELFQKFLSVEENRANFSINRQLIEFRHVPEEEIIMKDGTRNFDFLKSEFVRMKFNKIIVSWEKYCKSFDCIKY